MTHWVNRKSGAEAPRRGNGPQTEAVHPAGCGPGRDVMSGAPVTNWEEIDNFSDTNVITASYLGLGPSSWKGDGAKNYREQSPITYGTRIKAPTQAFALYHALKDNGVKTEFIGFAGRAHASADPVNARERTRPWIDWVKQHIGNQRSRGEAVLSNQEIFTVGILEHNIEHIIRKQARNTFMVRQLRT